MRRAYKYSLDYPASLLSAFDIGGFLLLGNIARPQNGVQHDMSQLINDQKVLEEDYQKAREKVARNQEDRQ